MNTTMKTISTLMISCLCTASSFSQWNLDPDNPQVVSNVINSQRAVQTVDDGDGGTFIFWMDSRNDTYKTDIFGQHYNEDGVAQWEDGGREILNYEGDVVSYQVTRNEEEDELVIGSITRYQSVYDSLRVQMLDDAGAKMWPQDLLLAKSDQCGSPTYALGIGSFKMIHDGSGYVVSLEMVYCGGSNGNRITRFDSNGNLTGPLYGEPEGTQYYFGSPGLDRTYDGSNDVYLFYSGGNGAGAHGYCARINVAGDTIWGPLDVLENTEGLNYQFRGLSDENGIAFCYQSNASTDIFIRKLNNNGTWAWSDTTTVVCGADGGQGNFYWLQDEDYYYVCWADSRLGVVCGYSDIYAQKIDKLSGEVMWAPNGIPVFQQCSYIPYPEFALTAQGEMIVLNESTGADGFNAQMVNADGSLAWSSTIPVAIPDYSPFYDDYQVTTSGVQTIIAWADSYPGGGADGIYIAKLSASTQVSITEDVEVCDSYTLNNITYTESGTYVQQISADTLLTLNLTITSLNVEVIINGNMISAQGTEGTFSWLDCSTDDIVATGTTYTPVVTGNYALVNELNGCADTSGCIAIIIDKVNALNRMDNLILYPNPVQHQLTVTTPMLTNGYLKITDSSGRIMIAKRNLSGTTLLTDISMLAAGIYQVEITDNDIHCVDRFVKE
jgi:hypothetical protein